MEKLCRKGLHSYVYDKPGVGCPKCKLIYRHSWRKGSVYKNYDLKKRFGMTVEEYNSKFNSQNGCCAICKRHQSSFKKALSVDHDHDTGQVRDLLCTNCNTAIGLLQENIESIQAASLYIKKWTR